LSRLIKPYISKELEDTTEVIRERKSKRNRQYNDKMKKDVHHSNVYVIIADLGYPV
jgi:hypothetical protein